MPIPLGIFATAGASAAAGPSYEFIETINGNGSANSITFSSISTTAYKHLQLRMSVRSTQASYGVDMPIRFNSDSANNYFGHTLYGQGDSVYSENSGAISSLWIQNVAANANDASVVSGFVIDILDYADTNKFKTTRILQGVADTNLKRMNLSSGLWRSTSAISSITISSAGAFNSISRFSLYGIKG